MVDVVGRAAGTLAPQPRALVGLLKFHLAQIGGVGRCGFGSDFYDPQPREHPAAYALYARGLAALYRITGDAKLLDATDAILARLLELALPGNGLAWGLNFASRQLPATEPYAVTTAFCALAFLERHRCDGDSMALEHALEAGRWLAEILPWMEERDLRGPTYSPNLPKIAVNVAGLVAQALQPLSAVAGEVSLRRGAFDAFGYVRETQMPEGYWPYSTEAQGSWWPETEGRKGVDPWRVVDHVHSSYVLDGCCSALAAGSSTRIGDPRRVLSSGIAFHLSRLHDPDGTGREKLVIADQDDPVTGHLLSRPVHDREEQASGRWLVRYPGETRLWGYGASIGMLSRAAMLGAVPLAAVSPIVRRLLRSHASSPSGRFPYLPQDRRSFTRHEAHLFEGLCAWAEATTALS